MYIHAGRETTEKMIHVMYRVEPTLMTIGSFKHVPSRDDVRTFGGVDRDKEARQFVNGLHAAAFLIREAKHEVKLNTKLGTEGNVAP